jgi:O-antigen/teichoic acid export membrane protein
VGVLVAIWLKLGLIAIFLAFLFSAVVRFVFGFAISRVKFVRLTLNFDPSLSRRLLADSLPIGISFGLQQIYMRQGTVLLQAMRGDAEVGLFAPALRGYTLVGNAAMAFVGSLFPPFSELYVSAKDKLALAYESSLKFMISLILPLGVFAYAFADEIVHILLGRQFEPSALALRLLVPAIVLGFVSNLFSFLLKAVDRQGQDTMNYVLCTGVNLGLSLLFIPTWGFIGASMAMVVSEAIFFALGLYLTFRVLPGIGLVATMGKPLLCGLLAAVPTLLLQKAPVWMPLLSGGGVYILSLLALGVFSPQETRLIWELASSLRARLERLRAH